MKRRIIIASEADRDLDDQFDYLAQESMEAAVRLLRAAQEAFKRLLQMPQMGSPRIFQNPDLRHLRMWPIPGFEKHLIFYRPTETGIEIIRVLHGARDIEAVFDEE
ncbi:MAG: type II toxin-antitoxin system RelE/ParE family toxin [bacterium]